MTPTSPRNRRR